MSARRPDVHGLPARADDLPAGSEYASRDRLMLSPGARLGPYEVVEPVRTGGMGKVPKARDTRLDGLVAGKTGLTPFNERFEREAHAMASLNHATYVPCSTSGRTTWSWSTSTAGRWPGRFPSRRKSRWRRQILEAVDAAHPKGTSIAM